MLIDRDTGEFLHHGTWHDITCRVALDGECTCQEELTEPESTELFDCPEMKSGTLED